MPSGVDSELNIKVYSRHSCVPQHTAGDTHVQGIARVRDRVENKGGIHVSFAPDSACTLTFLVFPQFLKATSLQYLKLGHDGFLTNL
jgi:hypothetical protein